jgi:7-keto-8-aminopelargonate synthetase-like enzyme
VVGENRVAIALAGALRARGILAHAIRPPTVPPGTARLRVTPMATHTNSQIDATLLAFEAAARETGILP